MGLSHSPRIVTNGLVFFLDGGNTRSYSGSGATWRDLSGRNNNATLTNGPTFSSGNGGALTFNGTNQYGTIPYNADFNLSNTDYTLEAWAKFNAFGSIGQYLIGKNTAGANLDWNLSAANSTTLFIYSNIATTSVFTTVPQMNTTQWYHFAITSISGTIRIYLNGVVYATQAMSTSNDNTSFFTIGCGSWNAPDAFFNGNISTIRIYRKGLTQTEINQNINATRGRYGI